MSNEQFTLQNNFGDPAERRALLESVVDQLNVAKVGGIGDEIGTLSVGPINHGHEAVWSQIRSAPLEGFGGGELRLNLGSGHADTLDLAWVRRDVDVVLRMLPARRKTIAEAVGVCRSLAEDTLGEGALGFRPVQVSAVGFVGRAHTKSIDYFVEVEMLGPDLATRVEQVCADDPQKAAAELRRVIAIQARRAARLASLEANRWGGWIDETTRRILARVGMDIAFVVARLKWADGLYFWFDDDRRGAVIYWDEGVLRCEFEIPGTNLRLLGAGLAFGADLPDDTLAALPGRRLGEVLDHAELPNDAIITGIKNWQGGKLATLCVPSSPFSPMQIH